MLRKRRRDILAVALVACLCAALAVSPLLNPVRGLTLDVLTALRWQAFGPRHAAAASPAVVVAIDEESYAAAPFQGSPTITWTGEIGRVLSAVVEGGAAVVGFDVIFPASIEQSEIAFGDEPVGARMLGFDREFLRALNAAAARGKVVLGEVRHGEQPIGPAAGQRIAVGQQRNIRVLNVYSDADDVVRRVPLGFSTDDVRVPSMSLELAARALGAVPDMAADGATVLAGYRIPGVVPGTLTLNFEGGAEDIPTYSLADLRACAAAGDAAYFRRQFEGKVVLLGTVLDIEDRRVTSKRLATAPERASAPRCVLPTLAAQSPIARRTIAGVYIHATAVNNLIRREAVREPDLAATAAVVLVAAAAAAVAALVFAPAAAVLAWLGLWAAYLLGAVLVFRAAWALPLVEPAVAGACAMAAALGYRIFVADKSRRLLRKSFALYLSPQVIDRMVDSDRPPQLGGEMREVTLFFSDIAGFSSFSETLSPAALVTLMNSYLTSMTDIIEAAGGYVDKYVGDSIVAVFGAPLDDPEHARHAVGAALQCRARLEELNRDGVAFGGRQLAHRIGLNSGLALVGNVGSRRRFNYTAMGDAVNLASRLESANKYFGTSILASEATVALTGDAFAWREIDAIRVKGREQPVKVFDLLAEAGCPTPEQRSRSARYAEGLAAWRSRDFDAAVASFASISALDAPAAFFEARARELAAHPPGPDWEPVNTLQGK